ncbi:hypothetical protein AVEN_78601-1 [Araneus ventricosus]|uniref:Uncharacterized protein n=1 Tax=Araneus ventricosus TaxID=182803 RepID=A0A4Y2G1G2_ARAVE|nr:hypothetical protein AVEN_78601-1 [Araneus ventricosus]
MGSRHAPTVLLGTIITPYCNSPELLCVNCKQPHSSDSRDCPQWKLEKKIQELRARNNISYAEAKKLLPEQKSVSYSKVVQPATCSCGKKIQQPTNQQSTRNMLIRTNR